MAARDGAARSRPAQPTRWLPWPDGRPRTRTLVLVALLAFAVATIVALVVLTMPTASVLTPRGATDDPTPTLSVRIEHPFGLAADDVSVTVDGERVTTSSLRVRSSGRIDVRSPRLDDGEHVAVVTATGVGPLRRDVVAEWRFTVDTTPPSLAVVTPRAVPDGTHDYVTGGIALVTEPQLQLRVRTEAGTRVEVVSSLPGSEPVVDEPSDAVIRSQRIELVDGRQALRITSRDAAGNETVRNHRVLVDTRGPQLNAKVPRLVRDSELGLVLAARDPLGVELTARLDGEELEDGVELVDSQPAPGAGGGDSGDQDADGTTVDGDASLGADGDEAEDADEAEQALPVRGSWRIALEEPAFEGRHTLELRLRDSLGRRTTVKRMFVVDSSDQLADVTGLMPGARGGDVEQLHQELLRVKAATAAELAGERRTRTFGPATRDAVKAFQSTQGLDVDGIAGGTTLAVLTMKVVIDRGTRTLTLYRSGKVFKTWGVAVGSSQYPTPAGEFEIQSMQENPTWTPPDSDWAKGAEPIPPGPDNPLGTRWMAIDGTVGIHGTNNPASIGYSVSHGCIRMRIPDVEELFEIVAIGTPVTVV